MKLIINKLGCDDSCEYCGGSDASYIIDIRNDENQIIYEDSLYADYSDTKDYEESKTKFEKFCQENNIKYETGDSVWDWEIYND